MNTGSQEPDNPQTGNDYQPKSPKVLALPISC